jgi:hypothetical protein
MRLLFVPILLLACAPPVDAQPEPPVHVPPIEFTTGVSIQHSSAGAVASIGGNLTRNVAIVGEAGRSVDGTALLAGGRVGTSFYYDGKPPSAGRFFAQFLAGRQSGNSATSGTIVQSGAGGDVMLVPRAGLSLHYSLDYRRLLGAPRERSGARLFVGILIGPRT